MAEQERYSLSAEDHAHVFRDRIVPATFGHGVTSEAPVAILFGGQPGSGKSAAVQAAIGQLGAGAVEIAGDDYRAHHPAYARLLASDDKLAAFYTDRDTGRWVEMAIAYAAENRIPVVVEGTMRAADKVLETMARFRAAGFEIEARALAVPEQLSWQGVLQRYESQKEILGHGRMTHPDAHEAAYSGMLITLERIEAEGAADRVQIYRRGSDTPIYENTRVDGEWVNAPGAARAVLSERERPFTLLEHATFERSYALMVAKLGNPERRASEFERSEMQKLWEDASNGRAAAIFRQCDEEEGLAQAPHLLSAYRTLAALTTRAAELGQHGAGLAEVRELLRDRIAMHLQRGEYPDEVLRMRNRGDEPRDR